MTPFIGNIRDRHMHREGSVGFQALERDVVVSDAK